MPLGKLKQAEYQKGRRARIKAEKQPKPIEEPLIDADGNAIPEYD